MGHIAICFHSVTAHDFHIDIIVGGVHIVPLAIHLHGVPVMDGGKGSCLTEHGDVGIEEDLDVVHDVAGVGRPIGDGVGIVCGLIDDSTIIGLNVDTAFVFLSLGIVFSFFHLRN